jgi:uncharacterized membrane protein YcaP (DUF421 family)
VDAIIRGIAVYAILLIVFRVAGRRTLAQTTPFDLVLLLIISETIQQSLVDQDHFFTNGILLVLTLVGVAILLSLAKQRWPTFEKWLVGLPIVVVKEGELAETPMDKERVDRPDVLDAARLNQGLEAMDDVRYAVVEPSGEIAVIPRSQ